jgi:hypothetical protein
MIESRFERCFEASDDPPPTPPVGQCQDEAVGAYDALLPRTQKLFEAFLQDLSEPIDVRLTGGEKAIAIENAVGGEMMHLARARATILTGGAWRLRHPGRRHPTLNRLFGQLPDLPQLYEYHVARRLQQRWVKLRNGDCAAHPVPQCAARLDLALTEVLDSVLNDK